MKLRTLIFWPHLIAGVCAGLVILVMSLTGVLLTYERQINTWADSGYRSTVPSAHAQPLTIEELGRRLHASHPDIAPTGFTIKADPSAAVTVAARQRTLFVDRYTGAVVGESSRTGIRQTMSRIREWHRYLGVTGEGRPIAKAITGWSNLVFLFIVVSGMYLWFPRQWTAARVKAVTVMNFALRGKARDFNWHNAIGVWSAIPLFIVVLGAVPISFQWGNALVYRVMGEEAPRPNNGGGAGRGAAARAGEGRPREEKRAENGPAWFEGIDTAWALAAARESDWVSIAVREPESRQGPLSFAIDRGDGGQPQLKSTLLVDPQRGHVVKYEAFSDLTPGRRVRNILRFAHTGEVLGIPGQTIAGLASAGGLVLVWTGLALALRRFRSWLRRRRTEPAADEDARESTAA
jgi:uncharacterized iron-regulated membrane protein